jgi:hypothetical protein
MEGKWKETVCAENITRARSVTGPQSFSHFRLARSFECEGDSFRVSLHNSPCALVFLNEGPAKVIANYFEVILLNNSLTYSAHKRL